MAPLLVRAPLLVPAIAVVSGAWLAGQARGLPVVPLVALAAAAWALGWRRVIWLGWLAVGLLWSEIRWAEPRRELERLDRQRPVALTGEISGCWALDDEGESAWLRVRWARQGRRSTPAAGRVRIRVPAAAEPRGCGGLVRVRGVLRAPQHYRNVPELTVGSWSMWVKSGALLEEIVPADPLARASHELRRRLFSARSAEGRPGLALARAFLLGDGRALPAEQREAMRRLGLAHLVAVSGLNVGMVAAFVLFLLLRLPRPLRLLGTLAGIGAYALLVGPLPSLLRALLMATVVLVGLLMRRLPAAINALAAACLLLILVDPSWVDDLGFQLSVAATVGLMALTPPLMTLLRPLRWAAGPLAVTLAAQLATLPWALSEFHRLTPAAPLANLVAVPWAGVVLAVALCWGVARLVVGDVADGLLPLLDVLAWPLPLLETIPASTWVTLPMTTSWSAAWFVTALLCWCVLRSRPIGWTALRLIAAGVLLVAVQPAGGRGLELVMLDVGQGDALLVRDGERALLVDGGGWRDPGFGGRVLVPALAGLGVRGLGALAVTHADADHCGGAADLVRELAVGEIWVPSGIASTDCGRRLSAPGGPPVRELQLGERRRLGRWVLEVLGPAAEAGSSSNERSLVLLARAGGRRVLLTGDVEAKGEVAMLVRRREAGVACDVLKVAHHGSRTSTGRAFLAAARPRLALVSVAAGNAYGHPAPSVLAGLRATGAQVLRTDRHGRVQLAWEEGGPVRVKVAAP